MRRPKKKQLGNNGDEALLLGLAGNEIELALMGEDDDDEDETEADTDDTENDD